MTHFAFEPSGKVKLPTDAELAAADEDTAILGYSCGTLADGRPYWAYIAVKPSLYKKFCALSTAGQSLVLNEYGTVIAADYEAEPPPEIIRAMQEKYGCDPDYTHRIAAEINRQQQVFVEKHEEQRIMDIVTMLKKKQG